MINFDFVQVARDTRPAKRLDNGCRQLWSGFGFEVSMSRDVVSFSAVEELAGFVHSVLCDKDALDSAQAPLFRTPLRRGGRVCGLVFHVEGPRLLRTSAVWSSDDARIIFYDSSGLRFKEVALSENPEIAA